MVNIRGHTLITSAPAPFRATYTFEALNSLAVAGAAKNQVLTFRFKPSTCLPQSSSCSRDRWRATYDDKVELLFFSTGLNNVDTTL